MPSPIYRGMYYPHNIDFLWHAASMDGRGAETVARRAPSPRGAARDAAPDEGHGAAPRRPLFALARFGRWEEILREPAPPADLPFWRGVWH